MRKLVCEWLWVNGNCVTTGMVLKVNRNVIEDASWLHPAGDVKHMSLAELDATIKGVNLVSQ